MRGVGRQPVHAISEGLQLPGIHRHLRKRCSVQDVESFISQLCNLLHCMCDYLRRCLVAHHWESHIRVST